jgi:hypothetical protein
MPEEEFSVLTSRISKENHRIKPGTKLNEMSKSIESSSAASLGKERFKSDKRQLGGMLMLLGTTALVFPLANIASRVGPDGTTVSEGIPLSSLVASVFVVNMGIVSMVLGYLSLVHDYGNKYLTGSLIAFTQLAWMPFITDLTDVGRTARSGVGFIPEDYDPSEGDVRFVGAMGMMGILGYGTGFLGSLAFIQFALFSYQNGTPQTRPGSYYRGRLGFYSFLLFLVGLSQLLLGIYTVRNFGQGPLENGPIGVAMYLVFFPEISIFCGSLQLLVSIFGFARSVGVADDGPDNHSYQTVALVSWICTVSMQILTQVAYAPGPAAAAMAPSVTMLTLGSNVLPAFLDFKMRTTPDEFPTDYYGLVEAEDKETTAFDEPDENQENTAHQTEKSEDLLETGRTRHQAGRTITRMDATGNVVLIMP